MCLFLAHRIPVQNGNTTVEQSFVINLNETFFNSLQKKLSSEISIPKAIPSKKIVIINSSTSNLVQLTALKDNTIFVCNKQYHLVKGPFGHIKNLMNGNKILVKSPPTEIIEVSHK